MKHPDRLGCLGPCARARLVKHLPVAPRQPYGRLRVLCQGVGQEASHGKQRAAPPCADGPGHHGDAIDDLEGAPVQILINDVFQRLEARDEIDLIADDGRTRHGRNLRVGEMAHQPRQRIRLKLGVGIEGDHHFGIGMGQAVVEGGPLSAVRFGENVHTLGVFEGAPHDLGGGIAGSVVDDDDLEVHVGRRQQRMDRVADHLLFVEGGNERHDRGGHPPLVLPPTFSARMHEGKAGNPNKPQRSQRYTGVEKQR